MTRFQSSIASIRAILIAAIILFVGGLRVSAEPNASDVSTVPAITSASGVHGVAAGPDGNLWFTEHDVNKIGRITPAGVVTEFPIPGVGPDSITAGPDGQLWFTENDS